MYLQDGLLLKLMKLENIAVVVNPQHDQRGE